MPAPAKIQASLAYAPFLFKPNLGSSLRDTVKLLKLLADTKNLRKGTVIHAHLVITGQVPNKKDATLTNSLINLYGKCGRISVARQLFDQLCKRNVVSWGALMGGYLHAGLAFEVLGLFKCMVSVDYLRPNKYIASTVISSCSDCQRIQEGKQCHAYVLKSGLVFHQYVKNSLIYMYSSCSEVEEAMQVLDSVPGCDVFCYNSVIGGLLENGYSREALEILGRMMDEDLEWDTISYVTVFGLCAHLKDLKLGLQLHCRMLITNVKFDIFLSTSLLDMYGKCGEILHARKIFDALQNKNVISWTALMAAYLQNGYFEEALNLYSQMEFEDVLPNEYTFAVLINSSAGLSALRPGELLHTHIEKLGFKDHVMVGNALINMYSKSGYIQAANKIFSDMVYRDIITWNAMISGYSHHGLGKEALTVFQSMLDIEVQPNHVTFVGVLSACCDLGIVEEGLYYLNQLMDHFKIEPRLEHYTCIVGLLSKAGKLDEALNFMGSAPVKWDVIAWRTLLSACHVHRNYGLGKKIADCIIQMHPHDVGTYTLLSNIYAKAKRWDGVANIRKLMRERSVKKEPGVSWIEIRSVTHVFVSEDNNHPECNEIYEKVHEMLAKIKQLGYVPDIAAVLHDVEDEQKERYLSFHSEKLAVAYGLMKTPPEAPLCVIKNLRICDDCHSAIKLISKVTKRVIIVRDANRFHQFQDGNCSCGDYW